mmetsp:Transcript_8447/g.26947  ORF Transcript_8447/g.26947 Transcript_8447/m.26947 type:complete len:297 (-) Transcript_8447:91-981(-)
MGRLYRRQPARLGQHGRKHFLEPSPPPQCFRDRMSSSRSFLVTTPTSRPSCVTYAEASPNMENKKCSLGNGVPGGMQKGHESNDSSSVHSMSMSTSKYSSRVSNLRTSCVAPVASLDAPVVADRCDLSGTTSDSDESDSSPTTPSYATASRSAATLSFTVAGRRASVALSTAPATPPAVAPSTVDDVVAPAAVAAAVAASASPSSSSSPSTSLSLSLSLLLWLELLLTLTPSPSSKAPATSLALVNPTTSKEFREPLRDRRCRCRLLNTLLPSARMRSRRVVGTYNMRADADADPD